MITKDYIITAAQGMHARPATNLVKLCRGFSSVVSMKKGDKTCTDMRGKQVAAKKEMSFNNSGWRDVTTWFTLSKPEKIDFGHFKLKLFSWYFNLMEILLILYN